MNTEKTAGKYYIVDFSSVKEYGLDGIENLSAGDNVIVFYVRGESSVDFSLISRLYSCGTKIIMKEIEEKSLLPFAICMYMGRISNEKPEIYLICNNGENYIKVAEFSLDKEINISLQKTISGKILSAPEVSKIADEKIRQALKPFCANASYILQLVYDARNIYPENSAARCRYVRDNINPNIYLNKQRIFIAIQPYI